MKKCFLLTLALWNVVNIGYAQNQTKCVKDDLGHIFCAPPGGYAVRTLTGVVCAPGICVTDNLGYLKCSQELGGGAIKDDLGRVSCVGGCVRPSKEFCIKPSKEK